MKVSNEIQQRIAMIRFIMIFGVVLLHTPLNVTVTHIEPGMFNLCKAYFQCAVFRTSVPLLTTISGFLLFSSNGDLNIATLFKKKFKTLVIPFLFFNLTVLLLAYFANKYADIKMSYDLMNATTETWFNAAFGLETSPINYPLNFLRDLVVIMLFAPFFGILLRNAPITGLILTVVAFSFNMDQELILRDNMPIMFYVGGMAAVCKWNMKALDRFAPVCLAIFLAACAGMIEFKITNTTYLGYLAPFVVWPATVLLHNTKVGNWLAAQSKYSFFIFIAHAPILAASWVVYQKTQAYVPYQMYWLFTPVIISTILVVMYKVGMKVSPTYFGVVVAAKVPEANQPKVQVVESRKASAINVVSNVEEAVEA